MQRSGGWRSTEYPSFWRELRMSCDGSRTYGSLRSLSIICARLQDNSRINSAECMDMFCRIYRYSNLCKTDGLFLRNGGCAYILKNVLGLSRVYGCEAQLEFIPCTKKAEDFSTASTANQQSLCTPCALPAVLKPKIGPSQCRATRISSNDRKWEKKDS